MATNPFTADEWLNVANERGADAADLQKCRTMSIGSFYLSGYAIECAMKGYLQKNGVGFPQNGRIGHNLKGLWKLMRHRLSDLNDTTGCKTYFFEKWCTDLRYQTNCPEGMPDSASLVDAAKQIVNFIKSKIKRG